jgi:hypothetical protein
VSAKWPCRPSRENKLTKKVKRTYLKYLAVPEAILGG